MQLDLYFHLVKITIYSECRFVIDNLKKDFSWFEKETSSHKTISFEATVVAPDFSKIKGFFLFSHLNSKSFGWRNERFIQYKNTLCYYNASQSINKGWVKSENEKDLYQALYYMIIGKIGELLDLKGLTRFHSLGVSIDNQICLFNMGINGGKTTLGLEFLKDQNIQLLSEDTPLINNKAEAFPFPVRISTRPGTDINHIPDEFKRNMSHPLFGDKILIHTNFYKNQIVTSPKKINYVFFGEKLNQYESSLKPMGKFQFAARCFRYGVLGWDCPQRAEIFFRLSLNGLVMMTTIFFKRLSSAFSLWKTAKPYTFEMSSNIQKNADFIKNFINGSN